MNRKTTNTPPVTAKSARNFWLSKMNQTKNTTSWKKNHLQTNSAAGDATSDAASSTVAANATSSSNNNGRSNISNGNGNGNNHHEEQHHKSPSQYIQKLELNQKKKLEQNQNRNGNQEEDEDEDQNKHKGSSKRSQPTQFTPQKSFSTAAASPSPSSSFQSKKSSFQSSFQNIQQGLQKNGSKKKIKRPQQEQSSNDLSKHHDAPMQHAGEESEANVSSSSSASSLSLHAPQHANANANHTSFQSANSSRASLTATTANTPPNRSMNTYHRRDDSFLKSNSNSSSRNNSNSSSHNKSNSNHFINSNSNGNGNNNNNSHYNNSTTSNKSSNNNHSPYSTPTSPLKKQFLPSAHEDGAVGEMQIKLDIAAAKLLTEEMKFRNVQDELEQVKMLSSRQGEELESLLQEGVARDGDNDDDNANDKNAHDDAVKESERRYREEMDELYLEIERLHESHRAERVLVKNREKEMTDELVEREGEVKDYEKALEEIEAWKDQAEGELARVQAKHEGGSAAELELALEEKQKKLLEKEEKLKYTMQELKEVKEEMNAITIDFKDLADETERLEIELEAVTEDRDELLRRSVVYQSPEQTTKKSLSGSNRPSYEIEQHEAETDRLKAALDEQEVESKMKDRRIRDLETLAGGGEAKAFELDLSAIDVENTSLFVEEKEARKVMEEEMKETNMECSRLNKEVVSLTQSLENVTNDRDKLKDCLADAMNELELYDSNSKEKELETDRIAHELMQVIKEREAEIDHLSEQIASETRTSQYVNASAESFQEELNNVVEWLDSSTRLNGSPSIEMRHFSAGDNVRLTPADEAMVQSIHRFIKSTTMRLQVSEADLNIAKNLLSSDADSQGDKSYKTSTEASFERGGTTNRIAHNMEMSSIRKADDAVKNLRAYIKATRDEIHVGEKTNDELRKSLSEAADLIKPLNEHVQRIESERLDLQSELASSTNRIIELEKKASTSNSAVSNSLSIQNFEDHSTQFVKMSTFDLRKKDDEIVSLRIEVNQFKAELKEAESDLAATTMSRDGQFVEMSTPTKSNRGKDRSAWQGSTQSSNEEDDSKTRLLNSEIETLKRDLKKRISAEETLKVILRDSSNRLTIMSTQAEQLAGEKNAAENHIKQLEREKIDMQEQVMAQQEIHANNDKSEEVEALLKEAESHHDKLSMQILELRADLKMNNKERKKLKKSLSEGVGMLNSLRSHVETSEKERKKLKKVLRIIQSKNEQKDANDGTSPINSGTKIQALTSHSDGGHIPDPDKIENETTILKLRSHIVEMEYEIHILEERIDEFEITNPRGESVSMDENGSKHDSLQIRKLKEELAEAKNACEVADSMLNEVAEINKEMLTDLKQTEDEAAESLNELNALTLQYNHAREEINDAKYVTTFAIQKLDGGNNNDQGIYGEMEDLPLADCINHLDRRVQALLEGQI
jgi:hypothetical protein